MLEHPDSLLGRLQRGRGDAVRELLRMPVEAARLQLVQCLCTEGDLGQHDEGFIELVTVLSPDLSSWYRWIETLAADVTEETRLYTFNLLGELSVRGDTRARAFLDRYVLDGCHWRDALSQYLVEGVDLDRGAWSKLLPRLEDEELAVHVYCKLDDPSWIALAAEDERLTHILRVERDRRAQREAAAAWSHANYAAADLSQQRWRVLESLLKRDPQAAAPYLIDGLWDGSHAYRNRCIDRCDLGWPGVRERLVELANIAGSRSATVARRRINGSSIEGLDVDGDRGPTTQCS